MLQSLIQAGNSPNLGVSHHLEVIETGVTYISTGNSPNLGRSHHPEVNGNRGYLPPSRELTQPWCEPSPSGDQIRRAAYFGT